MKPHHKARLRKLIAFFRVLPRKRFRFSSVRMEEKCGSVCCAIGLTPEIFPKLVRSTEDRDVELIGCQDYHNYINVGEELFGLSERASTCLFTPYHQTNLHPDLDCCGNYAAPKQVAAMLEKFLALVEAGEIEV